MHHRTRLGSALLCGAVIALTSAPAHAIFGFGVHAGKDFVSIGNHDGFGGTDFEAAATSLGYSGTNVSKWSNALLTRGAIKDPWLIGGQFYVDAIPFVDIEVSADVALQKYSATYSVGGVPIDQGNFYFGRVSAYLTARRDIVKFPPLVPIAALYLGGGINYNYVSPMAGPDLIVKTIGAQAINTSPNLANAVGRTGSLGWHALVGIRVKPPVVPIAFRIEGKYTATGISTFERPRTIFSLYLGTSFAM